MEVQEVLDTLYALRNDHIRSIFLGYGAPQNILGVKIGDMKPILKKINKQQELALQLYSSGVPDAMYLAGLAANGALMEPRQLEDWAQRASWQMISEYTVPWVAAEHPAAIELGLRWIDSPVEKIASSGWSLLAGLAMLKPDHELNTDLYCTLLNRIIQDISDAPDRVKYCMNAFVISVGAGMSELTDMAIQTAEKIKNVKINTAGKSCKLPSASEAIHKIRLKGRIGKKKKTLKC